MRKVITVSHWCHLSIKWGFVFVLNMNFYLGCLIIIARFYKMAVILLRPISNIFPWTEVLVQTVTGRRIGDELHQPKMGTISEMCWLDIFDNNSHTWSMWWWCWGTKVLCTESARSCAVPNQAYPATQLYDNIWIIVINSPQNLRILKQCNVFSFICKIVFLKIRSWTNLEITYVKHTASSSA